jgi:hypothetical protein
MDDLERRLRATLSDERLEVLPRDDALAVIRSGVRRRRRARAIATTAGVVAVAASAVGALVIPSLLSRSASPPAPPTTSLTRQFRIVQTLALPRTVDNVAALAVSRGTVWVGTTNALIRLNSGPPAAHTFPLSGTPQSIAVTPTHLWIALHVGSSCVLQERNAITGSVVISHVAPCSPSAQLTVTANGMNAWLLTGDTNVGVQLARFDTGEVKAAATALIEGAPWGLRPLAIGGSHVFVLSWNNSAGLVTRLSAFTLETLGTGDLPRDTSRLAYGTHRLVAAGLDGEWSLDAGSLTGGQVADDVAYDLTTGNSLLWTVTHDGATSTLVARDPLTGVQLADVMVDGTVDHATADGTQLWATLQRPHANRAVIDISPSDG